MKDKSVFIIYDPLNEKIICVHSEPNMKCNICESIEKERGTLYQLEEYEHLIQTNLKDYE